MEMWLVEKAFAVAQGDSVTICARQEHGSSPALLFLEPFALGAKVVKQQQARIRRHEDDRQEDEKEQGPGIRCLIEGGIHIDTDGRSTSYGPGAAWYESGPTPVFAQAAADRPCRFIRVMILPRTLLGKSSIQYVNEHDKAKPKSQQYRVFVDAPIKHDPAD